MPKLLRNTGKDFSFLNKVVIKLYTLYFPENTTNVHVEQQKTSSGGQWSVPSVLFSCLELDLLEGPRELGALFRKAELVWPVHAGALLAGSF